MIIKKYLHLYGKDFNIELI